MKQIVGLVTTMGRDCPKDNGWFSCNVLDDNGQSYHVTGICLSLVAGQRVVMTDCIEVSDRYGISYKVTGDVTILSISRRGFLNYMSSAIFQGIGEKTAKKLYDLYGDKVMDEIVKDVDKVAKDAHLSQKQKDSLIQGICDKSDRQKVLRRFMCLKLEVIDALLNQYKVVEVIRKLEENPYTTLLAIQPSYFSYADEIALSILHYDLYDERRIHAIVHQALNTVLEKDLSGATYLDVTQQNELFLLYKQMYLLVEKVPSECVHLLTQNQSFSFDMMLKFVQNEIASKTSELFLSQSMHLYSRKLRNAMNHIVSVCNHLKTVDNAYLQGDWQQDKYLLANAIHRDRMENESKGLSFLSEEQQRAVHFVLSHRLSFLKGGPGCGKTYTIKSVTKYWKEIFGGNVMILAPTGKAVNRVCSDFVGEDDVYQPLDVMTLCRFCYLIGARKNMVADKLYMKDGVDYHFDFKMLFVVDETSMVCMESISRFLNTIDNTFDNFCHIIFVGDTEQLPPIQIGAFLSECAYADTIEANYLPFFELTENKRVTDDSSILIDLSMQIRRGETPLRPRMRSTGEFAYLPPMNPDIRDEVQLNECIKWYMDLLSQGVEQSDILVLCPYQKDGVIKLNQIIRDKTNTMRSQTGKISISYLTDEHGKPVKKDVNAYIADKGWTLPLNKLDFRIGDRIMFTKNVPDMSGYYVPDKEYIDEALYRDTIVISQNHVEHISGLYNGDIGYLTRYFHETREFVFETDDNRVYRLSQKELACFVQAFAITFHKAQGSEAKNVLMYLPYKLCKSYGTFATRNLFYTGFTRAKEAVYIFGSKDVIKYMIDNPLQRHHNELADLIVHNEML